MCFTFQCLSLTLVVCLNHQLAVIGGLQIETKPVLDNRASQFIDENNVSQFLEHDHKCCESYRRRRECNCSIEKRQCSKAFVSALDDDVREILCDVREKQQKFHELDGSRNHRSPMQILEENLFDHVQVMNWNISSSEVWHCMKLWVKVSQELSRYIILII